MTARGAACFLTLAECPESQTKEKTQKPARSCRKRKQMKEVSEKRTKGRSNSPTNSHTSTSSCFALSSPRVSSLSFHIRGPSKLAWVNPSPSQYVKISPKRFMDSGKFERRSSCIRSLKLWKSSLWDSCEINFAKALRGLFWGEGVLLPLEASEEAKKQGIIHSSYMNI